LCCPGFFYQAEQHLKSTEQFQRTSRKFLRHGDIHDVFLGKVSKTYSKQASRFDGDESVEIKNRETRNPGS